ncbi:MAG: hypothetical protein AMXMBFR64_36200 [Myxococcales bacterium]
MTDGEQAAGPDARFLADVVLAWLSALLDGAASDDGAGALREEWGRIVGPGRSDLALTRVANQLSLDSVDQLLLVLAVAPYLDPRFRDRYRALQRSGLADRCTVALALDLLWPDGASRLSALSRFGRERPLLRSGLVTLEPAPNSTGDALVDQMLCVPQRTVDLLLGSPRLDERTRQYCVVESDPVRIDQVIVAEASKREVLSLVRNHGAFRSHARRLGFERAIPYGRSITILLAGAPGTGKTLFARALASTVGRPLIRVFSDKLAESQEAIEPAVTALFHDALLNDAVVFFDECEGLFGHRGTKLGFLLAEMERFTGVLLLATNAPQALDPALDRRIVYRMDFELPDPVEREQIWELHLPPEAPLDGDVDLPLLANLFNFPGGTIKNSVLVALNKAIERSAEAPTIDMGLLRSAAESQLRYNLDDFAVRSRVRLTLDDLVLPAAEREKLDEILEACRNKDFVLNKWGFGERLVTGKGIGCLFDGPPGTGKTLCAEILARELSRQLFRVHIPNIVSKWVGETEKNIAEIFGRARATHAILLFDEADSLFGKRTEVKSSNDRYANQEVNLLLQEIERFEGIVVLTTNLFGGLDDALKRRIHYRISFPKPELAERVTLWRRLIPREAPLAPDVDFQALGKVYPFSGGNIKNAVLRAAYRACADGGVLTMRHLSDAARLECESAGILVREAPVVG